MTLFQARLRPVGLCIGIVITAVLAWWLAGPENAPVQTPPVAVLKKNTAVQPLKISPLKPGEGEPRWEELAKEPPAAISLSPFQERLLQNAVLLEQRHFDPRGTEPAREVKLWRTGFKYPLVREDVWLRTDEKGRKLPVRRVFSVADHVMVQFPEDATDAQIRNWTEKHRLHVRQALKTSPVYLIAADKGSLSTADTIMTAFRQAFPTAPAQNGTAERDYLVFPSLLPNDTSFSQLWGLHNTGQTGGNTDADIDAPEAWEITTGSRDVVVAVIDTGVDRNHPDLAANMWTNPNEIAGNGVDDDGNGFTDDVNGWDFFSNDNNPADPEGHGTHCSGTIGGVGNNLTGVTGVCWQVSIVGLRFLGPDGGSTSDAIEAVNYARSLGVDLTSNSWGGGGYSSLLQTAIANAGAAGQLFIAAAGNDGTNTDLIANYPSGYAVDTIVSVASSTATDSRSSFSNYGATTVDLAAPGSSIYSSIPGSSYAVYSGTSMATPHVAGAAALLKSISPGIGAAEIKSRLMSTVDPLGAFTNTTVSRGRLNLARLIEQSAGPRPAVTVTTIEEDGGNGDGINNPGEPLALRFTVINRGNQAAQNVTATLSSLAPSTRFSITQGSVSIGTLASGQSVVSATPFRVQSQTNLATPFAEEFLITLTHGTPVQTSEYRVSIYLHTSARLEGMITDAGTTAPIHGAVIRVTGSSSFTTTSGADGRYSIVVTDGVYQVSASAPGYVSSVPVQLSAPPGRSGLNFALGVPQLSLTPPLISETVYSGRSATRSVEMRNRGSAPLTWSMDLAEGQTISSVTGVASLPEMEVPMYREIPDTGLLPSFKSQETRTIPAVNTPLGALTGARIGAVSTTWDRTVLINDLQLRGASVITVTLPLSEATLAGIDALIIDDAIANLTTSDVTLLRERIRTGMGLLCEADNSTSMARINEVFADTGILAASNGSFSDLTLTDIRAHPMTVGVNSLREVAVGASSTVSGSAQILVAEATGSAHAAVSMLGNGVVVFIGNEISDSSNFASGDARLFASQVIDGLVSKPEWLSANMSSGVLQPNASTTLTFRLDSGDLAPGNYQATAVFTTNIPGETDLRLPVTMTLVDAPQLSVTPASVQFGSVVQGEAAQRSTRVRNEGRGTLHIQSVALEGADPAFFSRLSPAAFDVPAGGFRDIYLSLATDAPLRALSATLTIQSDDPLQPVLRLPVSGTVQLPPKAATTTRTVLVQLKQGQTGNATVSLDNQGTGPLAWHAVLGSPPGQPGTAPTWVSLPGISGEYMPKVKGQIRLNFDTGVLPPGDFTTTLLITTNDVNMPEITIPVTLKVIAVPRPVLASILNFPTTIVGQTHRMSLPIKNNGGAIFQLSSPYGLGTSFRLISKMPFLVPPGETRPLEFEFRPTRAGAAVSYYAFVGNVPEKYIRLSCTGTGINGGKLVPSPASLSVTGTPGVPLSRTINLTNSGQLPVGWTAVIEGDGANVMTMEGPVAGNLAASASMMLNISLKTVNITAGTYRARLVLTNNTTKPRIEVPLTLTIGKGPRLEISPLPQLMISKAWVGVPRDTSIVCRNDGNQPLSVLSIQTSSSRLSFPIPPSMPRLLEPAGELLVPLRMISATAGDFTDEIVITTSHSKQKTVKFKVVSNIIQPPSISVSPTSLDESLKPGLITTRDISITNSGGDTLNWTASVRDVLGPAAGLPNILTNLDASQSILNASLPGSHALTEGTSGSSIIDGGSNMFETGNILSTDLNNGGTISYSNNLVSNHAGVGPAGSSFTRKHGALWVFGADLDGAARFSINGGLGAGGAGTATGGTATRTVAGVVYRLFFKRVSGATTPSVNHLIILEDKPGLAHQLDTSTGNDRHEVTGLSGKTRLYYILFGLQSGTALPDSTFGLLADSFLRRVVHPTSQTWLTPAVTSGSTSASATSAHQISLNTTQLPGGSYSATVRFSSNAPARPQVDVPVVLRVASESQVVTSPAALTFPDTLLGASSLLNCLVNNPGNLPLTIQSISTDDPAYTITGVTLPATLQPRQSLTASVRFLPAAVRDHPARLIISSNATGMPETSINITGRCLRGAAVAVSPSVLSVTVDPGVPATHTLTLSNTGDATLQWYAAASTGVASILSLPGNVGTVPAGDARQVSLLISTTATTAAGSYTGYVRFSSNDISKPTLDVPVTITIPERPRLSIVPSSVDFGYIFQGGSGTLSVQLRNNGNAPLTISSVISSNPAFDYPPSQTLPATIAASGSLNFSVRFQPSQLGVHTGQMRILAAASNPPEVTLAMTGTGVVPPAISVQPGQLDASLPRGSAQSLPLTVSNPGGATLTWQTQILNPSTVTGTLQEILQRFNAAHAAIIGLVPDLYLFTEGTSGSSILDGGGDMYDGGNYLDTSLGSTIPYSDNQVTSSSKLGVGGSYFTRKLPGLFVFVADMNDVSSFSISGNLGADGSGSASGSVLTRTFGGISYTGFLKTVSGTTDPSVNHLIIVETRPGISHTYSSSTDSDGHSVTGLSGPSRIYYLLFARADGRAVDDSLAGTIMDSFLQNVSLPGGVSWITASPAAGSTSASGTSTATVSLNATPLPEGTHTATVRFTSNAVTASTVDVPVTVTVTPPDLSASPSYMDVLKLTDNLPSTRILQLTAREGSSPAWTASATVPWISLSKNSGTGSDTLTLTFGNSLSVGSYNGAVNITYDGVTTSVPVNLTVRADAYTRLLTDYRHPDRVLGLIQGATGQASLLVALDATTLSLRQSLALPSSVADMDTTTDGTLLYALSHSAQSITEVNLDTFVISRVRPVPSNVTLGASCRIKAGRENRVYYTDSTSTTALHVFDFLNGFDLSSYVLVSGTGIDGFDVSPDGSIIYARSRSTSVGNPVYLARLNSSGDALTQTHVSASVLTQGSSVSPVFFSAARDAVYTQDASFAPLLGTTRQYPSQSIITTSAYGHALVGASSILSSSNGASLQALPVSVSVAAFTGAQNALVYYNAGTQQLVRLPLDGIITLPPITIQPQIPDGTMLATAPGSLSWSGSPLAASYDFYLGTDAVAVAAATNSSGGIYRGNTTGVSFTVNTAQFTPGLTYYWRIDIRNHDGSTVAGPVWSFRLPSATATPSAIDVQSSPDGVPVSVTLGIATASGATAWTLDDNAAWLALGAASGTGAQNVNLTFNPASLASGTYTARITLTSGADSIQIPVTFRILGTLNIVKMIADPVLPRIYALHQDTTTSEGWLLWIDPVTAKVQHALLVGPQVLDFAVSSLDDRLYALSNNGTTVVSIDRQTTRQPVLSWVPSVTAAGIHNGPVGRVVLRSPANVLQMHHSVTGGTVGTSVTLPATCVTRAPGNGSFILAAVQQTSSVTGFARYALSTGAITYTSTQYWAGTYSSSFSLSGDGTRAFYQNRVYNASTLAELTNLGSPVTASSWSGQTVWSGTQALASVNGAILGTLPFSTPIMASTADHSRLVLYNTTSRTLTSIDPAALLVAPATLSFGSITANQPAYRTLTLYNLTSQDLTFTAASNNTSFTVPTFPITVNAGLTAVIDVIAILPASSTQNATITLTCSQPQWSRTVSVTATTIASAASAAMVSDETAAAQTIPPVQAGFTFDINGDESPDIVIDPQSVLSTASGITTHCYNGTLQPGFDLSTLGVQASSVEGIWSDLTPELDFTVEPSATNKETDPKPFRVLVPASSADAWRFRFYLR